jgi:hypothetical protein
LTILAEQTNEQRPKEKRVEVERLLRHPFAKLPNRLAAERLIIKLLLGLRWRARAAAVSLGFFSGVVVA